MQLPFASHRFPSAVAASAVASTTSLAVPPAPPLKSLGRCLASSHRTVLGAVAVMMWLSLVGCKDPEVVAVDLTKEVDLAIAAQKWELAEKKAQEIVNLPKLSEVSRDQAKLKLEQARSEQQARVHYQKFSGYVSSDYDIAVAAYRDMPEGSYYRQLAKTDYERIRSSYIQDHLEKAESALHNSRCEDSKKHVQMVLDVDAQHTQAIELSKKPCPQPRPAK